MDQLYGAIMVAAAPLTFLGMIIGIYIRDKVEDRKKGEDIIA